MSEALEEGSKGFEKVSSPVGVNGSMEMYYSAVLVMLVDKLGTQIEEQTK